mmetsp:Transcript_39255/g.57331  ORF Transcript_39255/g.57331 Transcript_39255/m.57331 type:complete len:576 (+) Transcript_39255:25-1752(+)
MKCGNAPSTTIICLVSACVVLSLLPFFYVKLAKVPTTSHPFLERKIGVEKQKNADENKSYHNAAMQSVVTKKDNVLQKKEEQNTLLISIVEKKTDIYETGVFRRIIERVESHEDTCSSLPVSPDIEERKDTHAALWAKNTTTGLPFLPEFGIARAFKDWLSLSSEEKIKIRSGANYSPPALHGEEMGAGECRLPPSSSCHVSNVTAVLMSHATNRLVTLTLGLKGIASWSMVGEIILVWNSDRSLLENDKNGQRLLYWHNLSTHPLRIFFSLENGLPNCLLNRYHPMIQPKYEALMYFDDDGPFFSEAAMSTVGFELWRRNSDVQVGCFPRNIRFNSKRMLEAEKEMTLRSIQQAVGSQGIGAEMQEEVGGKVGDGQKQPEFIPTCRTAEGEKLTNNYNTFPHFAAHFILPSGSFLHRNYLCFIFHPALEELRRYVLDHPTKPDDITMSSLVSQLSGKAPRVFPRRINEQKQEAESNTAPMLETPAEEQNRRRLLWTDNMDIWAEIREEAINSVNGYFGSVNPGSVGWCAGTEYHKEKKIFSKVEKRHQCEPYFPTLNLVPWINEGMLGYNQCGL